MNTKKALPDLKLKILCVLADDKGHTSREIEGILDRENKKRIEEKIRRRPLTLLFDRKTGHILGLEKVPKKPQQKYKSIYKSNLSIDLRALLSSGYIYREIHNKERKPGERGHSDEFVYFIKKDAYSIIDKILQDELKKENYMLHGALSKLNKFPSHYDKSLQRFFWWNRTKNPEVFDRYIDAVLDTAEYKEMDGQSYRASIPSIEELSELIIDKENRREQLKSLLEDWIAVQLWLGLPVPPKDHRRLATLLPLSVDPMRKIKKMQFDKLMEDARQENIRITNKWIVDQKWRA